MRIATALIALGMLAMACAGPNTTFSQSYQVNPDDYTPVEGRGYVGQ